MNAIGCDEFVYVSSQNFLHKQLLSGTASYLYKAQHDVRSGPRSIDDQPRLFQDGKPAKLVVNRAGLGHAFWHSARIHVTEPLRDVINGCCRVRFVEASIVGGYCLPVDIIGESGLTADDQMRAGVHIAYDLQEWEQHWLARIAEKHKCDPPALKYFELVAAAPADLGIDDESLPKCRTPSRRVGDVHVSRKLLDEFGIMTCGGYAVRVDVWKRMTPFLNMPLFETMHVRFSD